MCLIAPIAFGCNKLGLGNGSPTAPTTPPAPGSSIVYAAIGASDVTGVGSSVLCPLADCPNGMGYVQVAVRTLRSQGFTIAVSNLGLPTAVIGPDFQALGRQFGRTIEGNYLEFELPFVSANAGLVTIFAGPNEVNTITAALGGGAGGTDQVGYINSQVRAFSSDLTALVDGVRGRAGGARLVILNVPNLAGLPLLTSASLPQRQAAQLASVGMTTAVNRLAGSTVAVVDLMCDTRSYQPSIYSSDGFHPNDGGYAFIAGEVVRAVTTAYPAPAASCGPMTIVPNP